MPAGHIAGDDTSIAEVQQLAVQHGNDPADGPDKARARKAGPGHGFRPVEVVENARKNVGQDVFGGAAAFDVLGRKILTLGGFDEVDLVKGDALLLGETYGGACRRA